MAQMVYDNNYVVDEMTAKGWPRPLAALAGDERRAARPTGEQRRQPQLQDRRSADETRWLRYQPLRAVGRRLANCSTASKLPDDHQRSTAIDHRFYAYNTSVAARRLAGPAASAGHALGRRPDARMRAANRPSLTAKCCSSWSKEVAISAAGSTWPRARRARDRRPRKVCTQSADRRARPGHPPCGASPTSTTAWCCGSTASPVTFDATDRLSGRSKTKSPQSTAADPGDLLPAGIGSQDAGVEVSHVRLLARPLLHRHAGWSAASPTTCRPRSASLHMNYDELYDFWSSPTSGRRRRREPVRRRREAHVSAGGRSVLRAGRQQPR